MVYPILPRLYLKLLGAVPVVFMVDCMLLPMIKYSDLDMLPILVFSDMLVGLVTVLRGIDGFTPFFMFCRLDVIRARNWGMDTWVLFMFT